LKEKVVAPVWQTEITAVGDPPRWLRDIPQFAKVGTKFADKQQSFDRYSSLADYSHGVTVFKKYVVSQFSIFLALQNDQLNDLINKAIKIQTAQKRELF
jgi:hypothetical protein